MRLIIAIVLLLNLVGCAGYQNWSPIQRITGTDGKDYYWLAPLPATADGSPGIAGRSAGVTTYTGTVNGRGYSVSSFR